MSFNNLNFSDNSNANQKNKGGIQHLEIVHARIKLILGVFNILLFVVEDE